jgi:hypothetical protein
VCWACARQLVEEGRAWGQHFDEGNAFGLWAEVLMEFEDRMGIPYPGIPDGEVFVTKPSRELTLRDLVRTIESHVPSEAETIRWVLESAAKVAKKTVPAADMDLPILQALGWPHWTARDAELKR